MFIPSVRQAINRHPLTTAPETPVSEVILLMSRTRSSCIFVIETGRYCQSKVNGHRNFYRTRYYSA
ncbi:MAG: CBS domain-containing protein [Planktothrix sp. GU0601_MAG3]|nr:MAG: CBS domain-containing protein [Planktothrix sp. GU0601_MAG3]